MLTRWLHARAPPYRSLLMSAYIERLIFSLTLLPMHAIFGFRIYFIGLCSRWLSRQQESRSLYGRAHNTTHYYHDVPQSKAFSMHRALVLFNGFRNGLILREILSFHYIIFFSGNRYFQRYFRLKDTTIVSHFHYFHFSFDIISSLFPWKKLFTFFSIFIENYLFKSDSHFSFMIFRGFGFQPNQFDIASRIKMAFESKSPQSHAHSLPSEPIV